MDRPGAAGQAPEFEHLCLLSSQPMCVLDESICFRWANRSLCDHIGINRGSVEGMSLLELIHPDDQRAASQAFAPRAATQAHFEARLRSPKQGWLKVGWTTTCLQDGYVYVVAHEYAAAENMRGTGDPSVRITTVGALAAGVAHEINNPLMYIMNNITFARENTTQEELQEPLRDAYFGAERVRDIVRDLHSFSRPTGRHRELLDVRLSIEDAIKFSMNEIRHRARLVRRLAPVPRVVAEPTRLAQVFLNLLLNAAHSIQPGNELNNEIRITTATENAEVLVRVEDTGSGVPSELLDKIFDPFFTTKPVGTGTGLGLSFCHNVIDDLGGRIAIETVEGQGSAFSVYLPSAAHPSAQRKITVRSQPALRATGSLQILVVDDDPLVARSLARSLRSHHSVRTALDGRTALQILSNQDFDLILCDVMMPNLTGLDVFTQAVRKRPELKDAFVFLTGGAFIHDLRDRLEALPNPRVLKPVSSAEILAMVAAFAQDSPALRGPPPSSNK